MTTTPVGLPSLWFYGFGHREALEEIRVRDGSLAGPFFGVLPWPGWDHLLHCPW